MRFNRRRINTFRFNGGGVRWLAPDNMAVSPYRDRTLLKVVQALLRTTQAFDQVLTTDLPESLAGSDRTKLAALSIGGWKEETTFDGDPAPCERLVQFFLTICVRHPDPESRDDEVDRLSQVASNAVNLQMLGGVVAYQKTKLFKCQWLPAEGVERRARIIGEWVQILDSIVEHNTSK
jgi:hypothetical protein